MILLKEGQVYPVPPFLLSPPTCCRSIHNIGLYLCFCGNMLPINFHYCSKTVTSGKLFTWKWYKRGNTKKKKVWYDV